MAELVVTKWPNSKKQEREKSWQRGNRWAELLDQFGCTGSRWSRAESAALRGWGRIWSFCLHRMEQGGSEKGRRARKTAKCWARHSGSSRDHRILGNISDTPQLREREFLKEGAEFQDWVTHKWSRLGGKEGLKTAKMLQFECQFCDSWSLHPKLCKNSTCRDVLAVAKRVRFKTIFSPLLELTQLWVDHRVR